jgi:thiamine kinase
MFSPDLQWESALARVPGALGEVRRTELLGGLGNTTWRVSTREGVFAVRLHAPWATSPGIDRGREARLQEAAAVAGLAPNIVAADPAGRFLVTEFVDGAIWQRQDMASLGQLRRLSRRLSMLHALPAPAVAPFDLGELLEAQAAHVVGLAPQDWMVLRDLMRRAKDILGDVAAAGRRPCIVHNDLYHANLIGEKPIILDWEYAAVADPLSDLACLLAYYPEARCHIPLLLEESGLDAALAGQLQDLAWVYMLISWLWYRRYDLADCTGPAEQAMMGSLKQRLGI